MLNLFTWPAAEKHIINIIRKGIFALKERWVQKRWAPPVTPKPATPPIKKAAKKKIRENKLGNIFKLIVEIIIII